MADFNFAERRQIIDTLERDALIDGNTVNWRKYLHPTDQCRMMPAEALAETCREQILLGKTKTEGLTLPWNNSTGRVLIKPGKLCIWTGWSRHGKTQMLKQVMLHAIAQGEKVLIASMEEEVHEVWIDLARVYTGGDSPTPRALDEFVNFVRGKLWLYDQQGTIEDTRMQAVLRLSADQFGTTQAVVDSLMMLRVSRDDYDQQSRFVGELKSIAKDTHQTIHLVAHMRKREGKGGEESPGGMHDIAGGHEIGSKADYVFNVWRDIQRKDETKPDCLLTVEKQRGDVNWVGKLVFNFHPGSRQFIEGNGVMRFNEPAKGRAESASSD